MNIFCPQCGQQQASEEIRFCSRCGLPLTAVTEVVSRRGEFPVHMGPARDKAISPRKRGLKQGLFIFLLTFLFAPIVGMISVALRIPPFGVGIVSVLFFMGGLLRMIYALMFESPNPGGETLEQHLLSAKQSFLPKATANALPPQHSVPASDYVTPATGNWRDTNELATPGSVTENTTRLLEKDQ